MKNIKIKIINKLLSIFLLLSYYFVFLNLNYATEKKLKKEILKNEHMNNYSKELNWNNIKNDFEKLVHKYEYLIKKEKNIREDSPIWVMWYQGIKNAPQIVQSCIRSIIRNRAKHHVYILDKYNLENYIKLPSFIIEKFNNRRFSVTHFSDIVRLALLCKYGGYWIDSTYFISSPIININTTFYSLKLNYDYIHKNPYFICKWAGNFLATSRSSFIATYGYLSFLYYWKQYNSLIDYFLLDYVIYVAYNASNEFHNTVDNLPYICNILSLVKVLNSEYNNSDFKCHINKLKWRGNYTLRKKNIKTNYAFIIETK